MFASAKTFPVLTSAICVHFNPINQKSSFQVWRHRNTRPGVISKGLWCLNASREHFLILFFFVSNTLLPVLNKLITDNAFLLKNKRNA
uniref:Uncharacterized protein n=1 Tax=Parascaris univalens TaxID=6257 RepID=A0A915AQQ9_PARUN